MELRIKCFLPCYYKIHGLYFFRVLYTPIAFLFTLLSYQKRDLVEEE